MPKYEITRSIVTARGSQTYRCEARSKKEAFKKFEAGQDEFVDDEIEVTELEPVSMNDIEEIKDSE